MEVQPRERPVSVVEAMHNHHLALERALSELLERAYEDDREELRAAFKVLEGELRSHLELEERELLPRFDQVAPAETERVRVEHALIRSQLDALGIALDLRSLRAHTVADFVALLHAHGEREEAELYKWADAALTEREKWPLLRWIVGRVEEYGRTMGRHVAQ